MQNKLLWTDDNFYFVTKIYVVYLWQVLMSLLEYEFLEAKETNASISLNIAIIWMNHC